MGISWLHISDLHIYKNTYYDMIKLAYEDLAQQVKLDFIVVTGDYCHYNDYPEYDRALEFLNYLVQLFGVSKNDVFLVPGNHDARNTFSLRRECISRMNETIGGDPDAYMRYMHEDEYDLRNAFTEYNQFIRDFYGREIKNNDVRVTSPSDVITIKWQNKLNIIMLNTALASKNAGREIFDVKRFLDLKSSLDLCVPAIILAHHSLDDIAEVQKKIAINFFRQINVKAYLCGDKHLMENYGIVCDYTTYPIPIFICGKSVPQTPDNYSDISVILYRCDDAQKVYVHPYEWKKERPNTYFTLSSKFDVGVDKRTSFVLFDKDSPKNAEDSSNINEVKIGDILPLGQINDKSVNWKVIEKTAEKLLLLSMDAIAYKSFCDNINAGEPTTSWDNCSLNKWLNREFLDSLFGNIIDDNKEIFNYNCKSFSFKNLLVEKVFLLSTDDFDRYIKNNFDLQRVRMHGSIINDGIYNVNGYVQWLLRSGRNSNMIATVLPNGKIDKAGTAIDIKHAIRPAMRIKIS